MRKTTKLAGGREPGASYSEAKITRRMRFSFLARVNALPRRPLLFLAAIGLLYFSLVAYLSRYHAVWSPDSGARAAMIRNWVEHGNLCYLHYDSAAVDPQAELHPLGDYALALPRGFTTIYSPFFPLLAGIGYRASGAVGLAFPALCGGLGTLLCSYLTARRLGLRSRRWLLLALALATPLVLYSVVFWDHTLHMALVAGVGYCLVRGNETRSGGWIVGAGVLLGIGLWFQELFVVLLAALVITAPLRLERAKTRSTILCLLAGFGLPAGAWAFVNHSLYGVLGGPHTLGPNLILKHFTLAQLLDPGAFGVRARLELVGDSSGALVTAAFAIVVVVYALTGRTWRPSVGRRAGVLGLAGVLAGLLMLRAGWSHGLLETTPLLIPALVPPAEVPRTGSPASEAAERWWGWMYATVLVFGFLVVLNPIVPGMDWGSRFLLTVLPLLALLSAHQLERVWLATPQPRRLAWRVVGAVLLVNSLASQLRGWQAIVADLAFSRHTAQVVRALPTETLVSDVWWLGPELALSPPGRRHLLVRDAEDAQRLTVAAEQLRLTEWCWLGSAAGLAQVREVAGRHGQPLRVVRQWREGDWTVAHLRR